MAVINRSRKVEITHSKLTKCEKALKKALSAYNQERITFSLEPHPQDGVIRESIMHFKEKGSLQLNYPQLAQLKRILEAYIVIAFRNGVIKDVTGRGTMVKELRDKVVEGIESLKEEH